MTVAGRIEFVANALIMVPVSFLGAVAWPRTNWRDWTAVGFVLSGAVEVIQAVALAGRSATFVDVVANTLGAFLGAIAIASVKRATAGRVPRPQVLGRTRAGRRGPPGVA